ncbi:MAG: hypothetical protein WAM28_06155 [Chlamydiales bacterium]
MRALFYLNLVFVCLIGFTAMFFFLLPDNEPSLSVESSPRFSLPKSPFTQSETIGSAAFEQGPLSLKWVPPKMQLPSLKEELVFYGKNNRPDVPSGTCIYHIGLKGAIEPSSFTEREPIYLVYHRNEVSSLPQLPLPSQDGPLWGDTTSSSQGRYLFSPNNQPTPLWLEINGINEQSVEIKVSMIDEQGSMVTSPPELHKFSLQATPLPNSQLMGWKLNGYRVDPTLLVRQKARWIGWDCFLEWHGGEEFAFTSGRERIDFLDGETPYSCYVRENDFLVWKEDHWEFPKPNEATLELPLLAIKKVDEKIMSLQLWPPKGKGSINLNLIRSKDRDGMPNLSQNFKFIGAKTWAQFIIECPNGDRMTLKANDWLLLTSEGWKELKTSEEIDDYVQHRLTGPLFVLDKLTKQNGQQVLIGHLFNTSRTEVQQVTLKETSLANFYQDDSFDLKNINIEGSKE